MPEIEKNIIMVKFLIKNSNKTTGGIAYEDMYRSGA